MLLAGQRGFLGMVKMRCDDAYRMLSTFLRYFFAAKIYSVCIVKSFSQTSMPRGMRRCPNMNFSS